MDEIEEKLGLGLGLGVNKHRVYLIAFVAWNHIYTFSCNN